MPQSGYRVTFWNPTFVARPRSEWLPPDDRPWWRRLLFPRRFGWRQHGHSELGGWRHLVCCCYGPRHSESLESLVDPLIQVADPADPNAFTDNLETLD